MSATDKETNSTIAKAGENLDLKTLFVRSIPFDATSEQLSDFFSQFCPVKHAIIVTDNEKNSRGFGFVSFSLDDDTKTALEQSRKNKFQGRLLRVDIAKRRDRKDKDVTHVKPEKEAIEKRRARLIIRNLPWSVRDPAELKKIFQKYGAVTDAIIPRKKGGKMSGFGFVTMKKNSSAENAIKGSQGLKIADREVAVDYAIEKSKWEAYKQDNEDEEESDEEESEDEDEDDESKDEDDEDEGEETTNIEDEDSEDADVAEEEDDDSDVDLDSDEEIDEEEEEKEEKPREQKNRQDQFSIFVRNLPYDADEDTLKEHFEQFGPVRYALPVIDKETGLAKGTAFVAFRKEDAYTKCLSEAPDASSTSILISDDVSPAYVYQGRILSITPTVSRESASFLTEKNAQKRSENFGKAPGEKDRRNLYLLNEGRITTSSKLASAITPIDLELREKSYKLRVQQLNKNPSLHLSLTRLAIRNLPRAMNAKAMKALGRKAVVAFATEVKDGKRQPLSKEEIQRSVKEKAKLEEDGEVESKRTKKLGVVRQAKVIMEVKGSGDQGRSRGYGFLEFRDHKTALMGLRWLNAHKVSEEEILEGLTDEEKKNVKLDPAKKRQLIVEFAVEHANVVKRRREKTFQARTAGGYKRKREDGSEETSGETSNSNRERLEPQKKMYKADKAKGKRNPAKKGNMNKGPKENQNKSGLDDDTKKLIGMKRKRRQQKHK
ncbi:Nucleolar protein 4 [Wickerhamomyces ciferrii]|uniref:Nucleolar protein 4 n=1 Tax=Wickerhamomyces ciferrii (strain ATCC 14091 / BCRC 22168 / CBS 111 / JCM 3599 / NBRC 0793 / NRRL Y-1031 F-60-10) TaxID=1206466 RepID=K0KUL4_WICCF|nr:Nucleolar protein 4 [Wickerhamomyces ciferrii]CCH46876.1 Nucleolar protein 4 [Wickerhamomyces ciferrii]